jgi:hypothetical protein
VKTPFIRKQENMMPNYTKPDPFADAVEILPYGKVKPPSSGESEFVTDAWLADQLQMAVATIRSQRFKRLHGHDHWLDIDPIYIGSKPRYRRTEAIEWLQSKTT